MRRQQHAAPTVCTQSARGHRRSCKASAGVTQHSQRTLTQTVALTCAQAHTQPRAQRDAPPSYPYARTTGGKVASRRPAPWHSATRSEGTTNKGGRRHRCTTRHAAHLCDNSTQHLRDIDAVEKGLAIRVLLMRVVPTGARHRVALRPAKMASATPDDTGTRYAGRLHRRECVAVPPR
jgi:hypothetical protein